MPPRCAATARLACLHAAMSGPLMLLPGCRCPSARHPMKAEPRSCSRCRRSQCFSSSLTGASPRPADRCPAQLGKACASPPALPDTCASPCSPSYTSESVTASKVFSFSVGGTHGGASSGSWRTVRAPRAGQCYSSPQAGMTGAAGLPSARCSAGLTPPSASTPFSTRCAPGRPRLVLLPALQAARQAGLAAQSAASVQAPLPLSTASQQLALALVSSPGLAPWAQQHRQRGPVH